MRPHTWKKFKAITKIVKPESLATTTFMGKSINNQVDWKDIRESRETKELEPVVNTDNQKVNWVDISFKRLI